MGRFVLLSREVWPFSPRQKGAYAERLGGVQDVLTHASKCTIPGVINVLLDDSRFFQSSWQVTSASRFWMMTSVQDRSRPCPALYQAVHSTDAMRSGRMLYASCSDIFGLANSPGVQRLVSNQGQIYIVDIALRPNSKTMMSSDLRRKYIPYMILQAMAMKLENV